MHPWCRVVFGWVDGHDIPWVGTGLDSNRRPLQPESDTVAC